MRNYPMALSQRSIGPREGKRLLPIIMLGCLLTLLLTSCATGSSQPATATPAPERVNGFGTALNHVHSLIALPGNVLIMATHYGIFRSNDDGKSWTVTAAGPGQLMEGLMAFSLVSSPLNQQRLYVATQIAVSQPKGTLGLYSSADQGRTWQLAIKASDLGNIFFVAPGNDTPDEVYVYLPDLGPMGLKVSMDAGKHFSTTGNLPFGRILGMLAIPNQAGQLLVYGSDGVARSSDGGAHWQVFKDIQSGIYSLVQAKTNGPIYASGDSGVYVSNDNGKSFKQVNSQESYGSLIASPAQPKVLYAKTGTKIFRSIDGGANWTTLPALKGNLASMAADPKNASEVYLSLSYPTELYSFDQSEGKWLSLTPKA